MRISLKDFVYMASWNRQIYSKERGKVEGKILEIVFMAESRVENADFTAVSASGGSTQKSLMEQIKESGEREG